MWKSVMNMFPKQYNITIYKALNLLLGIISNLETFKGYETHI
jgi:hypothetical protein